MNSDLNGTTKVVVELTGRKPTIEDVRQALDALVAEGIPETFEVDIWHREDREYAPDVPYSDRKVTHMFHVEAERAARWSEASR